MICCGNNGNLLYWTVAWRKGLLKTAHPASLILRDFPSSNGLPPWDWARREIKMKPVSIHPRCLRGKEIKLKKISLRDHPLKKKIPSATNGLHASTGRLILKILHFSSALALSFKEQIKWKLDKIYFFCSLRSELWFLKLSVQIHLIIATFWMSKKENSSTPPSRWSDRWATGESYPIVYETKKWEELEGKGYGSIPCSHNDLFCMRKYADLLNPQNVTYLLYGYFNK